MEQNIEIKMTKQEAIKYYANKIIEDSLAECSFRYKDLECNKYLAVDNSSGETYIDEFDTEEECINYLLETDDEDDN